MPTEAEPVPTVYRMKVWAEDTVKAKSKFWYAAGRRVQPADLWGWLPATGEAA